MSGSFALSLLSWLLRPFIYNNNSVTLTFSFVQERINASFNPNHLIMASFHVKSLFTNIPTDETIDITCFSTSNFFDGFTRQDLLNFFLLLLKTVIFSLDGKSYIQKDGVAMGFPLGPLFANIFLSIHECSWLADCRSDFKLFLYKWYVDDSFISPF